MPGGAYILVGGRQAMSKCTTKYLVCQMLISDMKKNDPGKAGQEVEEQKCVVLSRVIREGRNSLCYGHTDLRVNGVWEQIAGKSITGKGNGKCKGVLKKHHGS